MRTHLTCLFLFFSWLGNGAFAQSTTPPAGQYHVHFTEATPAVVRVTADLTLADSLLYMSPSGPAPERWPQYVQNLTVTNPHGRALTVEPRDSTAWILPAGQPGQTVRLQYEVVLRHEERSWPGGIDGVAFQRDWGVMTSGRALFVLNGDQRTDLRVGVSQPAGWQVATPWAPVAPSSATYRVPNQLQLQESLLFAGTHREITIERDSFSLVFVLGGTDILAQEARYTAIATQVLDYYIDLMGGLPRPRPGDELARALVLINQSEQVDGEVIGNHLSMFIDPHAQGPDALIGWFMFAHEFFHLWNGKTLRFAGTESDWFKEGITNYYTLKALNQIGFIDAATSEMILDQLFYQRYRNDPGFGTLSPSAAATPARKDRHWGLVYGGGLFAGIGLDLAIRHNTENANSLDDGMRYLYRHFGGTDRTITNQELLTQLNRLGQTDFSDFLDRCIYGTEAVPLDEFLPYAGVSVDTSTGHLLLEHDPEKTARERALWSGLLGQR
jgi:predicted metalloprotease with PDZ domain